MIRVVLVDDERPARDGLRLLIERDPEFRVVGEAASGRAALAAIDTHAPDLVFLDIQMPDMTGFEVLSRVPAARRPRVIFVTAYDQHALGAFEVAALDYLLKPVAPKRLAEALDRAKNAAAQRIATATLQKLARSLGGEPFAPDAMPRPGGRGRAADAEALDRLTVRDGGSLRIVAVDRIRWARACGNYVRLRVGEREHLHRISMADLERRLPPRRFARIHRATLVNVAEVAGIRPLAHGDFEVEMRGGEVLRMSRRYRDRLA